MEQITILIACLVGRRWCAVGTVLEIPGEISADRAKHLVNQKAAVAGVESVPRRKTNTTQKPAPGGKKKTETPPPQQPASGPETPLAGLGIGERTLEHLAAAGLTTAEQVQEYLAAGKSLEDITGIGEKIAASIAAQVADL